MEAGNTTDMTFAELEANVTADAKLAALPPAANSLTVMEDCGGNPVASISVQTSSRLLFSIRNSAVFQVAVFYTHLVVTILVTLNTYYDFEW